jgi:hypothetical protein
MTLEQSKANYPDEDAMRSAVDGILFQMRTEAKLNRLITVSAVLFALAIALLVAITGFFLFKAR